MLWKDACRVEQTWMNSREEISTTQHNPWGDWPPGGSTQCWEKNSRGNSIQIPAQLPPLFLNGRIDFSLKYLNYWNAGMEVDNTDSERGPISYMRHCTEMSFSLYSLWNGIPDQTLYNMYWGLPYWKGEAVLHWKPYLWCIMREQTTTPMRHWGSIAKSEYLVFWAKLFSGSGIFFKSVQDWLDKQLALSDVPVGFFWSGLEFQI